MNVTATFDGASVTIVEVGCDGGLIHVTYVDASGNLKVTKKFISVSSETYTVATGATVN